MNTVRIPDEVLEIIKGYDLSKINGLLVEDSNDRNIKHKYTIHFQSLPELREGQGDNESLEYRIINAVGGYYYYRYEGTLNGIFCT